MKSKDTQSAASDLRKRALRLIFEYKGEKVKLVSAQRLAMIPPPPQALMPTHGERGSWFELRDRKGKPLYRRSVANPIARDLEVFGEDPGERLTRVPVGVPGGTFFLIVPDLPQARSIVLSAASSSVQRGLDRQEDSLVERTVLTFNLPKTGKER